MKKTILITAGPTREKIDPVRYISNESSGTVGYEVAKEAKRRGYNVILILGPTALPPLAGVKVVAIESAQDLLKEIQRYLPQSDVLVMSAAVADFTPVERIQTKIKRTQDITLQLKKNPDILQLVSVPEIKKDKTYVGFCLETSELLENAKGKLERKNLDYIVGTLYSPDASPFGQNLFAPLILSRDGDVIEFEPSTKQEFARKLFELLEKN